MSSAGEPRVGRAVVARLRETLLGEVDGDDPLGACEPAADHRAEADEAAAEDGADRAGLDARGVEGGADPGREPARERRAPFERRLRAHLRERDLGHDGVLREGRRAHEVAQRIAVAAEPRRPVREEAEPLLVADRDAAVRPRAAAVDALAALGREQRRRRGRPARRASRRRPPARRRRRPRGRARRAHSRRDRRPTRCRGRCGRRRRRRAGRAPRPPSARRARPPGRRAAARTPRARRRGPSSGDPSTRCSAEAVSHEHAHAFGGEGGGDHECGERVGPPPAEHRVRDESARA